MSAKKLTLTKLKQWLAVTKVNVLVYTQMQQEVEGMDDIGLAEGIFEATAGLVRAQDTLNDAVLKWEKP